jgi:hypothetical protein
VIAVLVVSNPAAKKMEISALAWTLLIGLPVAGSMADRMWAAKHHNTCGTPLDRCNLCSFLASLYRLYDIFGRS